MRNTAENTPGLAWKAIEESANGFDYTHQAWAENGRYVACGHQNRPACGCYGSVHEGEPITIDAELN